MRIGCPARFVNIMKINNIHIAMECGMFIAEATFDVVAFEVIPKTRSRTSTHARHGCTRAGCPTDYTRCATNGPRSTPPSGVLSGVVYSGFDTLLLRGRILGPPITNSSFATPHIFSFLV